MKTSNIKFDFSDQTVLVIGGSRGIGKEVCKQFRNAGATVYCVARTDPQLTDIKFLWCDVSVETNIRSIFDSVPEIDCVINVAGTNLCEPIEKINISEWDRVMNVNLRSFFIVCRYAARLMKKQGYGRIVNVSSIAGRNKSIVSGVHYTSSKYGIIGLTKQLANEVSQHNILVNCVCPSQTMTEMLQESMTEEQIEALEANIPIRRIATTREQALPILFLCSDAASYITGATIDVNGGQL